MVQTRCETFCLQHIRLFQKLKYPRTDRHDIKGAWTADLGAIKCPIAVILYLMPTHYESKAKYMKSGLKYSRFPLPGESEYFLGEVKFLEIIK